MSACRICPVSGGLEWAVPSRSGMSLKIASNSRGHVIAFIGLRSALPKMRFVHPRGAKHPHFRRPAPGGINVKESQRRCGARLTVLYNLSK